MSNVKELIYYNESKYNKALDELEVHRSKFGSILVLYASLGLPALSNDDLGRLFNDLENLVIDKMITADPSIWPASWKREKANDQLNKPDCFEALEAAIMLAKKDPNSATPVHNHVPDIASFELVDGSLRIKESVRAYYEEMHKVYATTQRQIDLNAQLQIIANAMNKIREVGYKYETYNDAHSNFIEKAIRNNGPTADTRFEVRYRFITEVKY